MKNDRRNYIRTHISTTHCNHDSRYLLTPQVIQSIIDVYLCFPVTANHYASLFLSFNLGIRTNNPLDTHLMSFGGVHSAEYVRNNNQII